VSFSGGLIENIQSFAEAGGQLGYSTSWYAGFRWPYRRSRSARERCGPVSRSTLS
jgi:hypothetical protein